MKLDRECVRDLMLSIEDLPHGRVFIKSDFSEDDRLKRYEFHTAVYASEKLIEAGYVNGKVYYADNAVYEVRISSLTWEGHQFLDNIRDEGVWRTTKSVASKMTSVSLSLLSSIASSVISKMISQELGGL